MKTKDFPSVKQAGLIAKAHLAYHNEMMRQNETTGETKVKKLFVVETIVTIKNTYVVEAKELEHAYDEVTMITSGAEEDYFEPAMQKDLGETIIGGRKLSEKKWDKMLAKMEESGDGSYWLGENLIRRIDYDTPR
jgi:hypothetical protein